jgi:hypothetical protein
MQQQLCPHVIGDYFNLGLIYRHTVWDTQVGNICTCEPLPPCSKYLQVMFVKYTRCRNMAYGLNDVWAGSLLKFIMDI